MNAEQNAREAMDLWHEAAEADRVHGAQAAASVIAAKLAEKDADIARLREALNNIRALAAKRQNESGPDGNLADIEGFALAALKPESPDHD